MKRFIVASIFCALAIAVSLPVLAHPGEHYPNDGMPCWNQKLTPQQMEQAKKIFDDNYAATNDVRQQLTQKRNELDNLLASQNPDKDRIETLSREIGELRGKILSARVDARAQLAKEGLPADAFGPGAPGPRGFGRGNNGWGQNGPQVWHGGHHGKHGRPHGGWGCPGMMMMGNW